tara:strand:+ start:159 stop:740 length:582 start_codon:yes stop_codon:yes gene_type:complete
MNVIDRKTGENNYVSTEGYQVYLMLELMKCKGLIDEDEAYDLAWGIALKEYERFSQSKFNVDTETEYGCIEDYLKTKQTTPVSFDILSNENLLITCNDAEQLKELIEKYPDERELLQELLESSGYLGNDWYCLWDVGLTQAPVVAMGMLTGMVEGTEEDDFENIWWYPNYQVSNFAEILLEKGSVEFVRAKNN